MCISLVFFMYLSSSVGCAEVIIKPGKLTSILIKQLTKEKLCAEENGFRFEYPAMKTG